MTATLHPGAQSIAQTCPSCDGFADHECDTSEVVCCYCGHVFDVEPERVEEVSGCSRFDQEYVIDFDRQLGESLCRKE